MYDEKYAEAWIRHKKSGKEFFRVKYILPFMKKQVRGLKNARVLDVGCGWGEALSYLPKNTSYCGTDPTIEFFGEILKEHPRRNINLARGHLPSDIPFVNNFDLVICSMVLHCVQDLEKSVDTLFSKTPGGRVIIVDFNDDAEEQVRKSFARVYEENNKYIRGLYNLSDETQVCAEAYFHKEKEIEAELRKHGTFAKARLGPLFAGYSAANKA